MRRQAQASIDAYACCPSESFSASQFDRRWLLDIRSLKMIAYIFCKLQSEIEYCFTKDCKSINPCGVNSAILCNTLKSSFNESPIFVIRVC